MKIGKSFGVPNKFSRMQVQMLYVLNHKSTSKRDTNSPPNSPMESIGPKTTPSRLSQ